MFGELQSSANLAKYPANAPAEIPLRATARVSSEKRLERFGLLYGACQPMRDLFRGLDRLSRSTAPVMILGESGSGKELVATTLHHLSPRKDRPFIAVNCGAIPENLIESELFGHERGSFTGAARTHRGCFERADGGTLFLDEVTEMPVEMQVRLLRVLETGRFTRVGGDQEIGSDVRVLAASNRDLRQAVASGKLREDLMYRLCVIPVNVPPLRDRGDDVVLLAEMFLSELNEEQGEQKTLSAEGRRRIVEHTWPGNVRELKNVIHRAFVLSDEEVQIDISTFSALGQDRGEDSGAIATGGSAMAASAMSDLSVLRITVGMSLDDVERTLITATLQAVGGSKTEAARLLGISLKTMYNRLHAYGDGCIRRKPMQSNGYDALAA
ncbi:MAG TPA: sigma-54 dependent transcriptional regulator [Casimicrobiaceae bacterium]|jgi:DNA-binding NtrC family response regulator|nr:sigma-54 dependent transcriptional regulator [Casimicrobiaceae bacterium]